MGENDNTHKGYAYAKMDFPQPENKEPQRAQTRIAIVDEDWELADLFGNMLKRGGYPNVKTFRSAELFVNQTGAETGSFFDIVLMDYRIPVMDGIEAIRFLKKNHSSAKIIVMTGDIRVKKQAIAAGADGFLLKPFSVRVLFKEIRKQIDGTGN